MKQQFLLYLDVDNLRHAINLSEVISINENADDSFAYLFVRTGTGIDYVKTRSYFVFLFDQLK